MSSRVDVVMKGSVSSRVDVVMNGSVSSRVDVPLDTLLLSFRGRVLGKALHVKLLLQ